jgi:hypothetical protein
MAAARLDIRAAPATLHTPRLRLGHSARQSYFPALDRLGEPGMRRHGLCGLGLPQQSRPERAE